MMSYEVAADIETNGFLDKLTVVHSLTIEDIETGHKLSCADQFGYAPIKEGLDILKNSKSAIFQNGIGFDIPALKKVYPDFSLKIKQIKDTLVLTRLMSPHLYILDAKQKILPKASWGSHSLEAWGMRFNMHKGNYSEEMKAQGLDPWANWNPNMQSYCEQDTAITAHLFKMIRESGIPQKAEELEIWFSVIMQKQQEEGFPFNSYRAGGLLKDLNTRLPILEEKIKLEVEPWYKKGKEFTPKKTSKGGYVEGATFTRVELTEFKPSSRDHIADRLIKVYGWEPLEKTPTGKPKVDEIGLSSVTHPIGKLIADRFIISKRLSQIETGEKAWVKLVSPNGRIHGSVNTLGAVTGRCTHSNPNMAQIPSVSKNKKGEILLGEAGGWGSECRQLFHAPRGYSLVGADASGLELRCLAHFMAEFDGGEYAKILLEGDIHSTNQLAAGLPTRDMAKTFIYGFLYGAGDAKIGKIVQGGAVEGKALKTKFLAGLPALDALKKKVLKEARSKGYIEGIDGRKLFVRHEHAVLNTLLQSAGALLVKQATINLFTKLIKDGLKWGEDWWIAAHVHDEFQCIVKKELAKKVADVAVWSFSQAGIDFNWKCRLDGEAKIGQNWAETH